MGEHVLNSLREILRVARLEEYEGIMAEVILNAARGRCDDRFSNSQILENTRGGVNVGKWISLVRNDAHVAILDLVDKILQSFRSEIVDRLLQTFVPSHFHHMVKERGTGAVDPQFRSGKSLSYSRERLDSEVHAIPFD